MEQQVAWLETRADIADQRMGRVEDKFDLILERLSHIPSTAQMWGMWTGTAAIALAILGVIVDALAWLSSLQHG